MAKNRAMSSKRVTGPSPNTEMRQRIRVQEARHGGPTCYNSRTRERFTLSDRQAAAERAERKRTVTSIADATPQQHFH